MAVPGNPCYYRICALKRDFWHYGSAHGPMETYLFHCAHGTAVPKWYNGKWLQLTDYTKTMYHELFANHFSLIILMFIYALATFLAIQIISTHFAEGYGNPCIDKVDAKYCSVYQHEAPHEVPEEYDLNAYHK